MPRKILNTCIVDEHKTPTIVKNSIIPQTHAFMCGLNTNQPLFIRHRFETPTYVQSQPLELTQSWPLVFHEKLPPQPNPTEKTTINLTVAKL